MSIRTQVMSGFLRVGAGQVDAEPVGLAFRGSSLFVEPQVYYVEGARSQAHRADASVLLRGDQSRVLQDAQVLQERWQRHGERCREFGHDGWGLRQPFHDGPARRIREGAEHGVELVVILRHTPNYYGRAGARQPAHAWRCCTTGPGCLIIDPRDLSLSLDRRQRSVDKGRAVCWVRVATAGVLCRPGATGRRANMALNRPDKRRPGVIEHLGSRWPRTAPAWPQR